MSFDMDFESTAAIIETAAILRRHYRTCTDLAIKTANAYAEAQVRLYTQYENMGYGMMDDYGFFHCFSKFSPPIELKGIAV